MRKYHEGPWITVRVHEPGVVGEILDQVCINLGTDEDLSGIPILGLTELRRKYYPEEL